jgi:hypothetical protein
MIEHEKHIWEIVEKAVGRTVRSIHRVWTMLGGEMLSDEGEMQLTFADGSILFFKSSINQQTFDVVESGWIDPFAQPLDDATIEWLEEFGRPELVDVSGEMPYQPFIAQKIERVLPVFSRYNDWEWLCGVRFISEGDAMLTLTYLADNIFVTGDAMLSESLFIHSPES